MRMAETEEIEQDRVLEALASLSDVATSSANELIALSEDLADIRRHRISGWSWRRIASSEDSPKPLSILTRIASNFARASGGYRRALAHGLRDEGMQVTEIASLFEVSRQRVSALIRPRTSNGDEA
jgi:predicted XRE-type DNA-binding protein